MLSVDLILLNSEVEAPEILQVIKNMGPFKASGSNVMKTTLVTPHGHIFD